MSKPAVKMTKEIKEEGKPLQRYTLGNDLELWQVHTALLIEQSLNARSMSSDMFLQLTRNIAKRQALESLPFCALTDKGLEIISGHHRVRAARKAEIDIIWVLVDVSGISPDQLKSKQLSHNSISGSDNPDLVRQIFEQIKDVEARLEAYVEPDLSKVETSVTLSSKDLDVMFDMRNVTISFLPLQKELLQKALDLLDKSQTDAVYLATRDEYDTLVATLGQVTKKYDIRSTPSLFAKMCEIVVAHMEKDVPSTDASSDS